jgi:hypothetical protein
MADDNDIMNKMNNCELRKDLNVYRDIENMRKLFKSCVK